MMYDRKPYLIELVSHIILLRASTWGYTKTASLLLKVTYSKHICPNILCMPISYKHCRVDNVFIMHHKWVCDTRYIAIFHCSRVLIIFVRCAVFIWRRHYVIESVSHLLCAALIMISLMLANNQSHCQWSWRSCDSAVVVWSSRWVGHYHKPLFNSTMLSNAYMRH